jgi:predicted O-methyltransferase YrrM
MTKARIRRREDLGRRSRPIFAVLKLRPPMAQHSEGEATLLRRYARDARCAVEIGVAEGGSAWEIRQVLDPDGLLYLIDPYPPGRLFGLSMTEMVARRLVEEVDRGSVVWDRRRSHEAAGDWKGNVDFLLIDGDHSSGAVKRDWHDWSEHVPKGGIIAMHDALVTPGGRIKPSDGPAVVVREATETPTWSLVDGADSLAILRRER